MPRLSADGDKCRDEFVFAVTMQDPRSVELGPAHGIRIANRLASAEGYIGESGPASIFSPRTEEPVENLLVSELGSGLLTHTVLVKQPPRCQSGVATDTLVQVISV
jgi:hypothetical protein